MGSSRSRPCMAGRGKKTICLEIPSRLAMLDTARGNVGHPATSAGFDGDSREDILDGCSLQVRVRRGP
jgi:hypothetical protein